MTNEEIAANIASHEQKIKGLEHRVKDMEPFVEQIYKLTTNVELLGQSIKTMAEVQKTQGDEISKLKAEPAEQWKYAKKTIISTIIGAVVGALITGAFAFISAGL